MSKNITIIDVELELAVRNNQNNSRPHPRVFGLTLRHYAVPSYTRSAAGEPGLSGARKVKHWKLSTRCPGLGQAGRLLNILRWPETLAQVHFIH